MCPKSVVAGGDTKAGVEVVGDSPDGSLALKWHPVGGNADSGLLVLEHRRHGSRTAYNPIRGIKMMNVVLSQLMCLYQFFQVMGCSVM